MNKTDRHAEAERILREAVRIRTKNLSKEHFWVAPAKNAPGECLTEQKRFAEAEPLLLESYESLKNSQGAENPRAVLAYNRLVDIYRLQKKPLPARIAVFEKHLMTQIINQQRKIKLDWRIFETFAEKAFGEIEETSGKSATVAFVSDRRMRELNKQFRGKNSTTDVLSFPFEPDEFDFSEEGTLGDIVISLEQATRQAEENNLTFEREIKQLILHGILHLCGYDHEIDDGEMNARELELRDKLSI